MLKDRMFDVINLKVSVDALGVDALGLHTVEVGYCDANLGGRSVWIVEEPDI